MKFALRYKNMLAYVFSAASFGVDATIVKVEVDVLSHGLPGWSMVGLLETAVKEARDRVGSAIRNAGFKLPGRKMIINLSPADLKKSGAHYDLAIALSLLIATGSCRPPAKKRFLAAGELSLTGKVLPIESVLVMAIKARESKMDAVIVPVANAWEAELAGGIDVIGVETLTQAANFLTSGILPEAQRSAPNKQTQTTNVDFSEVRGQPFAKRGVEISAAGGHNIALKGPPGTGKTMLAERMPTILPPLSHNESLQVAKIMSLHGLLKEASGMPTERPFRAPHHCASYAGLVGSCIRGIPRPGEISLAHNGVLFLDEIGEFRRDVVEVLRQPMESGEIRLSRAGVSLVYPACFMLVVAFNPCMCGYFGHPTRPCSCSISQIRKYRTKLSGPLLDRIDIHIDVAPPPHEALIEASNEETSMSIRERVILAREKQKERHKDPATCNARLSNREIMAHCPLGREERSFLKAAASRASLSGRSVQRVIKVARTIADLSDSADIKTCHIAEAMQFRPTLEDIG